MQSSSLLLLRLHGLLYLLINLLLINMMNYKEIYLSAMTIDHDISLIKDELAKSMGKSRNWDANLNLSALIITDLQNYFLSPGSHAYIPSANAILPHIKKMINFFKEKNRPIIFTKHTNNEENAGSMNYWWKDLIREHSADAEIVPDLVSHNDIILEKHQYDAFQGTALDELLHQNNVVFPVMCGVMTNLCCESTVRTAFIKGFRPVLPIDATAAYNRQFHMSTFRNLSFGFSPLMTSEEVINKLK